MDEHHVTVAEGSGPSETASAGDLDRTGGVTLWKQIADRIRLDIAAGRLRAGDPLPSAAALGARFDVNRLTVRTALSSLERDGLVVTRRGVGSFVGNVGRLRYGISPRTRISTELAGQTGENHGELLSTRREVPDASVATRLGLGGRPGICLETIHVADGRPLTRSTRWFDPDRFPRISEDYRRSGSVTAALAAADVTDYVRVRTAIRGVPAGATDARDLGISPGDIVLEVDAVNADLAGLVVEVARTRFVADRVELVVDGEMSPGAATVGP